MISPVDGTAPYKEKEVTSLIVSVFYAALFICVDFSSGVVPNVGKFTKCTEYWDKKWGFDEISQKVLQSMDGQEGYPISLQVSSIIEEKCLGCISVIAEALKD